MPEIRVRFVPNVALIRLMAAVFTIAPVVLLPIVSSLPVIRPISAEVRPRLAELSAPPRFTPAPSVWISTFPVLVAYTVPVRFMLLAVRVIRPPFALTVDPFDKLIPIPFAFPGVLPEITTLPVLSTDIPSKFFR